MASEEAIFNVRVVMDSASIDQAVTRALSQIDEIQRRVASGSITPALGQQQIQELAVAATAQQKVASSAGAPDADLRRLTEFIGLAEVGFAELGKGGKETAARLAQYNRALTRESERLIKDANSEQRAAEKRIKDNADRAASRVALVNEPGAIQSDEDAKRLEKNARDAAALVARQNSQEDITANKAEAERLLAQENSVLTKILQGDGEYLKEVAEGLAARRRMNSQIGVQTQRNLAGLDGTFGPAGGADEASRFLRERAEAQVLGRRYRQNRDLLAERDIARDPTFAVNQGELNALRKAQSVREQKAAEEFLAADRDLIRETGELAALRRRRAIYEQRAQLDASRPDIGNEARLAEDRENRNAAIARARLNVRRNDPVAGAAAEQRLSDLAAVEAQKQVDAIRKRAEIQRNLASQEESIRTDLAEIQAGEQQRKLAVQRQVREKLGAAFLEEQAREEVAQAAAAETRRSAVLRLTLAQDEEILQVKARNLITSRIIAQQEQRRAQQELRAMTSAGLVERGSLYQRATAWAANRSGGQITLPTDRPTAGQAFATSALTTARFAASGALLYGGLNFARELITEATQLQVQLGIVESQFETVGNAAGEVAGISFADFRGQILDIARDTGVAADQVTAVSRRLAGTFADFSGEEIVPDFNQGARVADIALRLGQIAGLPQEEAGDAFSATILAFQKLDEETQQPIESFEQTAERIANAVVGLEQRYGTSTTEILQFTASLAGQASALGFTAEQLAAFGAVVESVVGSDVAASENFGRIFAGLQGQASAIADIFRGQGVERVGDGEQLIQPLLSALGRNDIPESLRLITLGYQELQAAGKDTGALDTLIAGERQARTFAAVMERGNGLLAALATGEEFGGQFEQRWENYRETVESAFERMQRAVEEFGLAIFEAGLDDVLVGLATAAAGFADAAKIMLEFVGALNNAFGGLPAKILGVVAAIKLLTAANGAATSRAGASALGNTLSLLPQSLGSAPGGLQNAQARTPLGNGAFLIGQGPNRLFQNSRTSIARRALAGGAGGRILSAVGNLSPLIAGIAVGQLYSTINEVGDEIQNAEQALEETVRQQIANGVSEAEVRQRLERSRPGTDLNAAERFVSVIGGGSGRNPFDIGIETLDNIAAEDTQEFDVQRGEAAYEVAAQRARERRDAANAVRETGGADYERQVALADEAAATADAEAAALNSALEAVRNDPTADNLAALNELLATFTDPALLQQFADIEAAAAARGADLARVREAAGRLGSQSRARDFSTAIALYERGEVSINEPLDFLSQSIRDAETIIEEAGDDATVEQLQHLFELEKQRTQLLVDHINQEAQITNELASLLGGDRDSPEARIATALSAYEQILGTVGATPGDVATAALALAQAEQDAFAEYVNGIEDDAEALAAAQGGFEYSREATEALVRVQLLFGENRNAVAKFADVIGITVDALSDLIVENMIEFQEDGAAALRRIVEARIETLVALQGATAGANTLLELFGEAPDDALQRAIDEQLGLLNLINTLGDVVLPEGQLDADRGSSAQDAERAAEEARKELHDYRLAEINYRRSFIAGDRVAEADLDAEIANENLRFARESGDRAGQLNALAELNNAARARQEAIQAIGAAQRDLSLAQRGDDPVGAAYNELLAANDALAIARGAEATLLAQAAQVRAQRSLAEAFQDIGIAQLELAQAMADAAGDSVESAEIALRIAEQQLADIQSNTPNDTAAILRAQANVVSQEAALRDSQLNERQRAIDVALQLEQITAQQAIAQLQALLQIPNLTQEQIDNLLLKIKSLQDELSGDFRFNLPTELYIPTAYEVRRLDQTGGGGYNDNRQINVQVFAQTNADPAAIGDAVAAAVGQPNRTGTQPRRY